MSGLTASTPPEGRVIVALDVPTPDEALAIAKELEGVISFYKVGLELLMSGGMEKLLRELVDGRSVFVDLKLPGDIPETVIRTVNLAAKIGVKFITLSNAAGDDTIRAAVAGRGDKADPKLLFVSFLSTGSRGFCEADRLARRRLRRVPQEANGGRSGRRRRRLHCVRQRDQDAAEEVPGRNHCEPGDSSRWIAEGRPQADLHPGAGDSPGSQLHRCRPPD